MQVLVDTCIWSLALRRKHNNSSEVNELKNLVPEQRVQIIGSIRQEVLAGISQKQQFIAVKEKLATFPDLACETIDYEYAADFSKTLRKKGIQSSAVDFLMCAVAYRYQLAIFTSDKDFVYFKQYLPIKLHDAR